MNVNCKFAAIAAESSAVNGAMRQSLREFGVLEEFESREEIKDFIAIPSWSGNRDFNVKSVKIAIVGSAIPQSLTYYFCNLDDCWSSLVLRISRKLECMAILVRSSPPQADLSDYIQEITVMGSGNKSRVLRVGYDDGWQFFDAGSKLSFEDDSNYARRKIKDRISRSYLIDIVQRAMVQRSEGTAPFLEYHLNRADVGGRGRLLD